MGQVLMIFDNVRWLFQSGKTCPHDTRGISSVEGFLHISNGI